MIVLRIADSHNALARKPQIRQRGGKASTLIDPAGQDHYRFFVKDDLQAKVQIPDRQKGGCIMRSHRCHNTLSHGKRHSLPAQIGHEFGGGGRAQESLLARCRVVKQSAILGDDPIEKMEARKYGAQAGKFAAGDQDHLSSRLPRPFQPSQSVPADVAIAGQSPIVVRGYRPKTHCFSSSYDDNANPAARLGELQDRAILLSEEEAACH
jgi:hypothetical protein